MKLQVFAVLLAIGIGIVVPPSLPMMACHDQQPSIGTLDLCHSAVPGLVSNSDMPCVNECPYLPVPLTFVETLRLQHPSSKPLLIILIPDHPPEA